jgi:hypothetical protein
MQPRARNRVAITLWQPVSPLSSAARVGGPPPATSDRSSQGVSRASVLQATRSEGRSRCDAPDSLPLRYLVQGGDPRTGARHRRCRWAAVPRHHSRVGPVVAPTGRCAITLWRGFRCIGQGWGRGPRHPKRVLRRHRVAGRRRAEPQGIGERGCGPTLGKWVDAASRGLTPPDPSRHVFLAGGRMPLRSDAAQLRVSRACRMLVNCGHVPC